MKTISKFYFMLGVVASLSVGSIRAFALPVLDTNTPTNDILTIYPDSQDHNLYYLVPKSLVMAHDDTGLPMFSYTEIDHAFSTAAVVQLAMTAGFDDSKIEKAKATIHAINPNAKFAPVPFISSNVVFTQGLAELVESSDCDHIAGTVGSDQSCVFKLSPKGRNLMRNSFRQKATLYMNFVYNVDGVVQDGKGGFKPYVGTWELTGAIGSEELARYPQLFVDGHGHTIRQF